MRREEFDHIRDDVATAILEAPVSGDTQVGTDILDLLLTEIERVALGASVGNKHPLAWASDLLRAVQLRAISGVPFGEPTNVDPPEDHR